jgi:hypothetical protein
MEDMMKEGTTLSRREFTLAAAMAALSGVAITISACGGNGSPAAPSATGDKTGTIGANHGHSAVITSGQLSAGGALSLNIRGTSDHPHTVTLTAAEISAIAGNGRVSKQSTTDDGHSHTVTFN